MTGVVGPSRFPVHLLKSRLRRCAPEFYVKSDAPVSLCGQHTLAVVRRRTCFTYQALTYFSNPPSSSTPHLPPSNPPFFSFPPSFNPFFSYFFPSIFGRMKSFRSKPNCPWYFSCVLLCDQGKKMEAMFTI